MSGFSMLATQPLRHLEQWFGVGQLTAETMEQLQSCFENLRVAHQEEQTNTLTANPFMLSAVAEDELHSCTRDFRLHPAAFSLSCGLMYFGIFTQSYLITATGFFLFLLAGLKATERLQHSSASFFSPRREPPSTDTQNCFVFDVY